MPHGTGWTLCTASVQYRNGDDGDEAVNVFHYNLGTVVASQTVADSIAATMNAYWITNISPNIGAYMNFMGVQVLVDDGLTQWVSGLGSVTTPGTAPGNPLAAVLTAIVSKRAAAHGRKRFGHTAHPGLTDAMMLDENHLNCRTQSRLATSTPR